tara:strand:- start:651 stop:1190 length:540 start_codon:yes stop_codon:yes gene_type:complete
MVDFAEIRKQIQDAEEYMAEEDEDTPKSPWRVELDNFSTAVPLSLGAGLVGAVIFDAVKNRGDEYPIFEEPWRTMVIGAGCLGLGWGLGALFRGTDAQKKAEYYEKVISAAESEAEEALQEEEEAREAEEQNSQNNTNHMMLTDPLQFQPSPSPGSLNLFGEYGAALGQTPMSYTYGGY